MLWQLYNTRLAIRYRMVRTSREPSPRRIRRRQHQAIRLHSERLPHLKLEGARAGSVQRKLEPSRKGPLLLK
jgi:hypothetical protein